MVVAFSTSWFSSVLFNVLRDYNRLPNWIIKQEYFFGIGTHCIAMTSTVKIDRFCRIFKISKHLSWEDLESFRCCLLSSYCALQNNL